MTNPTSAWGESSTRFFFELTPDRVLSAVETSGIRCTGRCMALGSFENRVYEVEIETDVPVRSVSDRFRVVKFYRPGRWTREQILEEHEFLLELAASEIPVIAPLRFDDGSTLHQDRATGIWYALFPRVGGRSPDEFNDEQLERVGRLLARIHNVGAIHPAAHRIRLDPDSYGTSNLRHLVDSGNLPEDLRGRYQGIVERIVERVRPWFERAAYQRVHGDCHLGNLLWNDQGPFFLDFDDMVMGPCVQDVWLLVPGNDVEAIRQRAVLIGAYEQMRSFDRESLRLVEPLRALRLVHFSAWISRRWEDPAFPGAFPHFNSYKYWSEQTEELARLERLIAADAQEVSRQGSASFYDPGEDEDEEPNGNRW